MIVFISGPYSSDPVLNTRRACEVADKVLEKGHIPFIPHLTHFWHYLSPKSYETWLMIDSAILPRCDCLLRIPGESKGADKEVELAEMIGMAIYYDIEDL